MSARIKLAPLFCVLAALNCLMVQSCVPSRTAAAGNGTPASPNARYRSAPLISDWTKYLGGARAPAAIPGPVSEAVAPTGAAILPDSAPSVAPLDAKPYLPEPDESAASADGPFRISRLEMRGDSDLLDELGITGRLRVEIVDQQLSRKEILDIAARYQGICVKAGFFLAVIRVVPSDLSQGTLILDTDKGRFGKMSFFDGDMPEATATPFAGKYFGEKQLRRQMKDIREGAPFDYNSFYRNVFSVNAHPDVAMNTDLRLRKELADGGVRRYADMEFFVSERRPIHGALEIKNTGTEDTDEWRASATLQHLNVSKRGDILTFNAISSMDFDSLLSVAASYHLPVNVGNGGALTVYGGYSDLEAKEIVPVIDLIGSGWFACLQLSYNLIANDRHLLSASLSAVHRTVKSVLRLVDTGDCEEPLSTPPAEDEERSVSIVPMTVAITYSSIKPDRLGGRNFVTSQTSFNVGGSDAEAFDEQRQNADRGYFIQRIQFARLQPLFGRSSPSGGNRGQWILFFRADAQYTAATLIPAEEKAVGGMDTVRGYPERAFLGDRGISGTIELRTPLVAGLLGRLGARKSAGGGNAAPVDHMQFVAFLDGGRVELNEPVEGVGEPRTVAGAGIGLRMAVTSHAQFRLDWGFPLEQTEEYGAGGRAHVGMQLQF